MKEDFSPQTIYRVPWNLTDNAISWLEPTSNCNLYCDGCYRENRSHSHKSLDEIQHELKREKYPSVKWVNPSSIHLTLKFLGEIETTKVQSISNAIIDASKNTKPFTVSIDKTGVFPNLKRPRVIWVGMTGDLDILHKLQQSIENQLVPLGFPVENRRFSPHLTLGRVRDGTSSYDCVRLGESISSLEIKAQPAFRVDSISFIRSVLTREGAIYSCLASIALQNT